MTTTARPTFGAWLTQQTERPDPVGDLARDYTAALPAAAVADLASGSVVVTTGEHHTTNHEESPGPCPTP